MEQTPQNPSEIAANKVRELLQLGVICSFSIPSRRSMASSIHQPQPRALEKQNFPASTLSPLEKTPKKGRPHASFMGH